MNLLMLHTPEGPVLASGLTLVPPDLQAMIENAKRNQIKPTEPAMIPAPPTEADLHNRFTTHEPKDDQLQRYAAIRNKCLELALFLTDQCPVSRELSVALTNLEQTMFWANAAIARNE